MKTLIASLLVALTCCWTLISSYYDPALNGWVCTYQSTTGTILTQVHKNFCPITPQ